MVEVMTPEQKSSLLAGYVLGNLSAEESLLVVQMLRTEPDLRAEIAELQASFDVTYGASAEPPVGLKASVLAGFERSVNDFSVTDAPIRSVKGPWLIGLNRKQAWQGLGAIAAGLIVALTVQNQNLRQTVDALQTQQVSPPARETIEVALSAATPGEESGQVSLVINPTELNAVLVAEELEPLAGDEVYVLWTVVGPDVPVTTDEKNAILTAVFTVGESGARTQEIDLPSVYRSVEDVKVIAVTVEDANTPQAHRSSPILIESLNQ